MLSTLPKKLTKESSIARILQFSVMIQVQERLKAQSNPSHEQSTLKLFISGFNKKLPKKESKYTVWTLKIKLLISLPKVLRGHCLKNLRKDLDWYHQRKCDLSIFRISNRNVGILENQIYSIFNPTQDSGLEERVNEKQHHESEAEYYLHYRGSVYCTEQEFGTFYMRSS